MINWYKFLLNEGTRNFLNHNLRYISFISPERGNATLLNLSRFYTEEEFINALKESNTIKIMSEYQIDELLGKGAMGLAFTLKDPHENYILKFQILDEDAIHEGGEVGTEYITHLYKKQEQDDFDPKELRVLDSEKGFATIGSNDKVFISATVMAKAAQTGISGKTGKPMTTDDVMNDIIRTRIKYIIMNIVDLKHATQDFRKTSITKKIKEDTRASDYEGERIEHLLKIGDNKNLFRLLYSIFDIRNLLRQLSEKQFIGICLQLYKIMDEAFVKNGYHVTLDLHSGNFGFRPNSDIPIFFDI
jgi:hypothetical protein